MRKISSIVGLALLVSAPAYATDASVTLTAGVVTQVLPVPAHRRYYEKVTNVGNASPPATAWCSRYDPAPAPFKAGSFALDNWQRAHGFPVQEEYSAFEGASAYVPQLPLWCTADSGTVPLTAEYAEVGY